MKVELTRAALEGINRFVRTTRGANMFGPNPEVAVIDVNLIQVKCKIAGHSGPVYFEVRIKEAH